ncbi:MAG: hypothetical protein PGN13_06690 [Patulibacter minatonensis]
MHRNNWRTASRAAAAVLAATAAYGVQAAVAQTTTPAATTPATTPSQDITTTGGAISTNGTENTPNAGTNECFTRLFKPKAESIPAEFKSEDGTDVVLQFRVRCSSPMSAFSIAFNRELSGIEAEIPVTYFNGNGVTKDQSFNCGGDTPGPGVNCVGTYKGGYNTARGLISVPLTDAEVKAGISSLCKLGINANLSTFYSEVSKDIFTGAVKKNADGTSQILNYASGPYRVTTPQCHKGAAAKKAAKK